VTDVSAPGFSEIETIAARSIVHALFGWVLFGGEMLPRELEEWAWRLAGLFDADACGLELALARTWYDPNDLELALARTCYDPDDLGVQRWMASNAASPTHLHALRAQNADAKVLLLRRELPFAPIDQTLLEVVVRHFARRVKR
jgi:hypothetical protein